MQGPDDALPPDYYGRLDVEPSASQEEIREAYREKARETHPDRNPEDPGAVRRFRRIQEAYRVLRDPDRRRSYDAAGSRTEGPNGLTITYQASIGCAGYLWRVLAGALAVGLFSLLEALDVWASTEGWTIVGAVAAVSLVAGVIAMFAARHFSEATSDLTVQLTATHLRMWIDGRAALELSWSDVRTVRLREDDPSMEVHSTRGAAPGLRPVSPMLTAVKRRDDGVHLRFDFSTGGVHANTLHSFLRDVEAIPYPPSSDGRGQRPGNRAAPSVQ